MIEISRLHSDLELVVIAAVLSAELYGQCNGPKLNRSHWFLEPMVPTHWIIQVFSRSVKRNFRINLLPNLEGLQENMNLK